MRRSILLSSHAADDHDEATGTHVFRLNETLFDCKYLRLTRASVSFERPLLHAGNSTVECGLTLPRFERRADGSVGVATPTTVSSVDFISASTSVDEVAVSSHDAAASRLAFAAIASAINAEAVGVEADFPEATDGARVMRLRAAPGADARYVPTIGFTGGAAARYVLGFFGSTMRHSINNSIGVTLEAAATPFPAAEAVEAVPDAPGDYTLRVDPSVMGTSFVAALQQEPLPYTSVCVRRASGEGLVYYGLVSASASDGEAVVLRLRDAVDETGAPATAGSVTDVVAYAATDLTSPQHARLTATDFVTLRVNEFDALRDACRDNRAFAIIERNTSPYATAASDAVRASEYVFDPVLPGLKELRVQLVDPYGQPYRTPRTFFRLEFEVGMV